MSQNNLYKKIKEQVLYALFEVDEAADVKKVNVDRENNKVTVKLNSDKSFSVTFDRMSDVTNNRLSWSKKLKKAVKKQLRKKSHKAYYIASMADDFNLTDVKGLEHLEIRSIYPQLQSFSFYATKDEVGWFTMKNNNKIVYDKNYFFSVDPLEKEDQSQVTVTPSNSTQNLPHFLQRIGASNSLARQPGFNYSEYAKDIYIFVLDSGIFRHAQLNIDETLCRDFTNSRNGWNDVHGHGTHVAGSIAARDANIGVAPGVKVIAHKILGDNGRGSLNFQISSLEAIATFKSNNPNAKIIVNMSLGAPVPRIAIGSPFSQTKTYDNAEIQISRLSKNNNITFVAAAGNSTHDASVTRPTRVPEAITVGAYDSTDNDTNTIARFSHFGPLVDITAPGVWINSTLPPLPNSVIQDNTRTGLLSGTSMAAPIVTGAIANMLAVEAMRNPNKILTPAEIRERLRNDAEGSFNNNNNNNPPVSINPQISMNNPFTNLCWANRPNPDPDGEPLPPLFTEEECNNNWFTSIGGQPSALNQTYPYSLFIGSYTKDGATVQNY